MKSIFFLFILSFLGSFSAKAQKAYTATQLQDLFVYFAEDLYLDNVHVDADGDVQFGYEGISMYISVNPDNLSYIGIFAFSVYDIGSEYDLEQAYEACNAVTKGNKAVKAYVMDDESEVMVTIQAFIDDAADFEELFKRSIDQLQRGVQNFEREIDR